MKTVSDQLARMSRKQKVRLLKELLGDQSPAGGSGQPAGEVHLSSGNDAAEEDRKSEGAVASYSCWLRGKPSQVALVSGSRRYSYADLEQVTRRLGARLQERGLVPGNVIGVLAGGPARTAVTILGILAAGGRPLLLPCLKELSTCAEFRGLEPLMLLTNDAGVSSGARGWLPVPVEEICRPEDVDDTEDGPPETGRFKTFLFPPAGEFMRQLDAEFGPEGGDGRVLLVRMSSATPDGLFHMVRGWRSGQTIVLDAGVPGVPPEARRSPGRRLAVSLLFFSSNASESRGDKYALLMEAARFADRNGFEAVWVPERHFHAVGGLFPNPAVVAAALAVVTRQIRLRAGSVVLPLHHPIRVAEEWSVVDNLSGGRVDLSIARGWNPNDFVISPDTFQSDNALLRSRLEIVRRLWRGEAVEFPNPEGKNVPTRIFPTPRQRELPVWLTCVGGEERFREAGGLDTSVLTMLFNQNLETLAQKVAVYRRTREERGLPPEDGKISLMIHAFVHHDLEMVKSKVRGPFLEFIKSTIDLHRHGARTRGIDNLDEEKQRIAEYSYERYFRTGALFGTPDTSRDFIEAVRKAGVDEIACQIDFGIDAETALEGLKYLAEIKDRLDSSVGISGLRQNSSRNQFRSLVREFRVTDVFSDPPAPDDWFEASTVGPHPVRSLEKPRWGDRSSEQPPAKGGVE